MHSFFLLSINKFQSVFFKMYAMAYFFPTFGICVSGENAIYSYKCRFESFKELFALLKVVQIVDDRNRNVFLLCYCFSAVCCAFLRTCVCANFEKAKTAGCRGFRKSSLQIWSRMDMRTKDR